MRPLILFPIALLAGCASAGDGRFPSLATRPGERISGTLTPVPAPAPPPATAATGTRLADLRAKALAAHRDFEGKRGRAASLVASARGAAVASEAWSVAQVALAELEAARSQAMIALADLDAIYVAESVSAVPTSGSGDLSAAAATREEVIGWIAQEDEVLAQLRGQVAA